MGMKLIFESKLYMVEKDPLSPMMREVSLERLLNVDICDPSHDRNLPIKFSLSMNVYFYKNVIVYPELQATVLVFK